MVLDWFTNILRLSMLLPLILSRPRRAIGAMHGYWGLALGVGVLSPLSYIIVLSVLTAGAPVSIVAPMREMSMMVGALMGMIILREPVGPARLAGCAVLVLGVILLAA